MPGRDARVLVGVLWVLVASAACGGSDADSPGDAGSDGGAPVGAGFGAYPGLDEGAVAVLTETTRAGALRIPGSIHVAPDGSVWLWRGRWLERYSPDGVRLMRQRLVVGDEDVTHVVFHPGGEISVAIERWLAGPTPDRSIPATELRRLSPSAQEIRRVLVRSEEPVTFPEHYRVAKDGAFDVTPGETVQPLGFRPQQLVADAAGGLYAVDRLRLYHLNADDAVVATAWLLPNAELPVQFYITVITESGEMFEVPVFYSVGSGELIVDHAGRVWAAFTAPSFASAMLSQHYGKPVELGDDGDDGDVFLVRWSPSLTPELVVSLPAPNDQPLSPQLAESAAHTIGVTGWSIEHREIEPNKTFNYNVFFAAVDEAGRTLAVGDLDLSRDEVPHSLAACGDGFCIGGITDSKWVDTGSQVDFARGFILKTSAAGERGRLWTLHGPRDNYVDSVAGGADGAVYFTAVTNGPITHTDPAETFAEMLLGKLP